MVTERISQCVERTLMYIKCYGVPWDFQSSEIQEVISPDPLMQLYTTEQASLLRIANNQEKTAKLWQWCLEYPRSKLHDKRQFISKIEESIGESTTLKLIVNNNAFVTTIVSSGEWTEDIFCIVTILLS